MEDKSMRAKQLASTVRQGRRITISILDEDQVEGYLCGMDDDTYFLICPTSDGVTEKLLISKVNVLFIRLHDERTFREEPLAHIMEPIVKPFREYITKEYFSEPKRGND